MFGVILLTEKPLEVVTLDSAAIRLGWKPFGVFIRVTGPADTARAQGLVNAVENVDIFYPRPAPEAMGVQGAHRGGQVLTAAEKKHYDPRWLRVHMTTRAADANEKALQRRMATTAIATTE